MRVSKKDRNQDTTTIKKQAQNKPTNYINYTSPKVAELVERVNAVYEKLEAANIPRKRVRFLNGC